jgi:hypothetical protein
MNMRYLQHVVPAAMLGAVILLAPGCKTQPQAKFTTPDQAAAALHQALKAQDLERMQAIFGREWMEAAASGDPVADRNARERLRWPWTSPGAGRRTPRKARS